MGTVADSASLKSHSSHFTPDYRHSQFRLPVLVPTPPPMLLLGLVLANLTAQFPDLFRRRVAVWYFLHLPIFADVARLERRDTRISSQPTRLPTPLQTSRIGDLAPGRYIRCRCCQFHLRLKPRVVLNGFYALIHGEGVINPKPLFSVPHERESELCVTDVLHP
jgi:hypothetical protein